MLFLTLHGDRPGDEDDALVRAARGGDDRAFETLICKYERLIWRTAYTTAGNTEDAADLTQEILLRVWHGLPTFRGNARFLTWLVRIARNTCCDYLRKKQRTPPTQPLELMPDTEEDAPHAEMHDPAPDADPHAVYSRREDRALVHAAMARLSEEHRMMIVMRDINGDTYETIAAALGLEVGTVKSRLSRARAHLRQLLAESGFFE